jgi:hypothetical protein
MQTFFLKSPTKPGIALFMGQTKFSASTLYSFISLLLHSEFQNIITKNNAGVGL